MPPDQSAAARIFRNRAAREFRQPGHQGGSAPPVLFARRWRRIQRLFSGRVDRTIYTALDLGDQPAMLSEGSKCVRNAPLPRSEIMDTSPKRIVAIELLGNASAFDRLCRYGDGSQCKCHRQAILHRPGLWQPLLVALELSTVQMAVFACCDRG